mmetsp:Transcript_16958/g.37049  ORF Transcript_16958/g.37049 Transcript_16958/m.37049 type:complete len:324 (+) Transcript_16958:148-1119(+)
MENIAADPCSAVAPLMRAMECIPENEDENAGRDSSASLFSSIRGLQPGSCQSDSNDPSSLLQHLKTRLESFSSCGWLTKEEYEQHTDFLSAYNKNDSGSIGGNRGKFGLNELKKELDSIEETKSAQPAAPQSWSDMFMSTLGVATSKKSTASSFWSGSNNNSGGGDAATTTESSSSSNNNNTPSATKPLATATNRVVNGAGGGAPTIVAPKDLSNVLSEDAVSEIFVETCFFARLGFVQPPSCMACTYKEALKGNIPNLQCQNWVIWRRNANKIFDPSNNIDIGENAIVVQCRSARKLLSGKTVEHYQWDERGKALRKKIRTQ